MNFGMLHLSKPRSAIVEASRVLKKAGHYSFSVWAGPEKSPAPKLMFDAIQTFADMNVDMPEAPDSYLFSDDDLCKQVLTENGFSETSFDFRYHLAEWVVPTAEFLFDTELKAGVRTAALLKRQSATTLEKIRKNVIEGMEQFHVGQEYCLPFCACIISARKE